MQWCKGLKLLRLCVAMVYFVQGLSASPVKKRRQVPKAPAEAIEPLKHAYAAWRQGHYEQAIALALQVYQRYGEVYACWWPSWAHHFYSPLPDPWDYVAVGERRLSLVLQGATPAKILAFASMESGRYEEALKWAKELQSPGLVSLIRWRKEHGEKPSPPPQKNTWRPLPLRFREEDYFVLVPLDEACKVLGLGCSITPSPKMAGGKGIRVTKPDAPNIVYRLFLGRPLVERLEGGRGRTETLAYAPYEEVGEVWVPFYWLAKQAGIVGWEVRNGKIYVAPKRKAR